MAGVSTLRVGSLNLRAYPNPRDGQVERLADLLARESCDIVLLQECRAVQRLAALSFAFWAARSPAAARADVPYHRVPSTLLSRAGDAAHKLPRSVRQLGRVDVA